MKKTLLQEVKAMNRIAGTQMTKEQEIALIKKVLNEAKDWDADDELDGVEHELHNVLRSIDKALGYTDGATTSKSYPVTPKFQALIKARNKFVDSNYDKKYMKDYFDCLNALIGTYSTKLQNRTDKLINGLKSSISDIQKHARSLK